MSALLIGVDPGLTTGLFSIELFGGGMTSDPIAAQVRGAHGVLPYVRALAEQAGPGDAVVFAIEAFVVGRRAGAAGTPEAGRITRALITELQDLAVSACNGSRAQLFTRTAALVKPWATDKRLDAADWRETCKGMHHAADAARQALYAAVHSGLMPDPLSSRAGAR